MLNERTKDLAERADTPVGLFRHRSRLAIGAILVLATALRVLGIWHGYPYSYYGDEVHFVERSLSFGSLDFNPHWFHKPAFYMYLLFAGYGLFYVTGWLVGAWASTAEFAVAYMTNPGPWFLIGRLTTALFGIATVWLVYELARRSFGHEAGLVSALLLAFSTGHVASSQAVKADGPTTFLTIASMYFLLAFVSAGGQRRLFLASILAGAGAATKYYSLVMLAPIWIAVLVVAAGRADRWRQRIGRAAAGLVAATASFWLSHFVCSPYNFLDPLGREWTFSWAGNLAQTLNSLAEGTDGSPGSSRLAAEWLQDPAAYVGTLLSVSGLGPIIGSLGLAGLVLLAWKRDRLALVFLAFPVAFTIGSLYLHTGLEHRHQLPLYPFFAIGGGVLVVWIAERLERKPLVYGALVVALLLPLYVNVSRGLALAKADTRNLAKAWIEKNIPAGSKLVVDEEGPVLLPTPDRLREEVVRAGLESEEGQFTAHYDLYLGFKILAAERGVSYDIFEIRFPWWRSSLDSGGVQYLTSAYDRDFGNPVKSVGVNPYQFYLDHGFEYAVVHSGRYERWFRPRTELEERYPGFAEFYRELFRRGRLVKEFDPGTEDLRGPVVKIFALR